MPKGMHEVPVYWTHAVGETPPHHDFRQWAGSETSSSFVKSFEPRTPEGPKQELLRSLDQVTGPDSDQKVWRVGHLSLDFSEPTAKPRGIQGMDLHALIELNAQLEQKRQQVPFELVVPGKIAGLAIAMLVDSGASVSVMSTRLWKHIKRAKPEEVTLLPTNTRIITASGQEVPAAGCLVLEVELAGEFYLHQFLVVDAAEDLILGLDFLAQYNVDCDWRRGVLRMRGHELKACRQYSTGDGKVRRLTTIGRTVLPANANSMVEVRVKSRGPGDLPDWGMVSPARKPMVKHGVLAGRALIDAHASTSHIPVMNPTDITVVLPGNTDLAFMAPVDYVDPLTKETSADLDPSQTPNIHLNTLRDKENTTTSQAFTAASAGAPLHAPTHAPWVQSQPVPPVPSPVRSAIEKLDDGTLTSSGPCEYYKKRWSDLSSDSEDEDSAQASATKPQPAEHQARKLGVPEHLVGLYIDSLHEIDTEAEQEQWAQFLIEYQDVFAKAPDDLGRTDVVRHRIETGDHTPIRQAPRRVPIHRRKLVQQEVEKMLQKGVIEPCDGPWASPIVLASKKGGEIRFCVDFRELNNVTKKDAYPLPRIEDNLDCLQGAHWYSTLDLLSGFWQVEVAEEDRDKTAFTVGGMGLYRFLTMPFGLCNAPATFQRLMERVLAGLQWEIAVLYIDDIIVFSSTLESHFRCLGLVLDRLRAAGLKLKPAKCKLLHHKVEFLGHIVSAQGVGVDPDKVAKVVSWATPTSLTQVRSFLGLCAYYRRFIKAFSSVAKPFFRLMEKGQEFYWSPACQEAFELLKKLLTEAPILAYPRPEGRFILDTDASNFGIGAVLSQIQDDDELVISYASKTLNRHQRNYCVTRREMLAIIVFVEQFHHYLCGSNFLVRTDHAALYWLLRKRNPENQMARWLTFLQMYDLTIEHRPGLKHGNADALSRCMEGCRETDSLVIPEGTTATLDQLKAMAREALPVLVVKTRAQTRREQLEIDQERELALDQFFDNAETQATPPATPPTGDPIQPVQAGTNSTLSRGDGPSTSNPPDPSETVTPSHDTTPAPSTGEADEDHRVPSLPSDTNSERPPPPTVPKPPTPKATKAKTPAQQADDDRLQHYVKDVLPATWSDEAIAYIQEHDKDLSKVRAWLREQRRPKWEEVVAQSAAVKAWWSRWDRLTLSVQNDVLYLQWESSKSNTPLRYRIVAVPAMYSAILSELHDAKTAGHLGQAKTVERVKQSPFYWPGMVDYTLRWVRNCNTCAARKHPRHTKRAPLQNYHGGATADRYSCDLCGPFKPAAHDGSQWIFTITDWYTRFTKAYALRRATAKAVAKCIMDFISLFGCPLELYSDNGAQLQGQVVQELCKLLGVRKLATVPYRPSSNGITERQNRLIKNMLAAFVNKRATDWPDHLDACMMAYRSAKHRGLDETPNAMMLGRQVRLPIDALVGGPPEEEYEVLPASEYVAALTDAMRDIHAIVTEHMGLYYQYQKKYYDRDVKPQEFTIGQPVWLRVHLKPKGQSRSLVRNWDDTWIVMARVTMIHYKIQKTPYGAAKVVHSDKLKPFYGHIKDAATRRLWLSMQPNADRVDRLAVEPLFHHPRYHGTPFHCRYVKAHIDRIMYDS